MLCDIPSAEEWKADAAAEACPCASAIRALIRFAARHETALFVLMILIELTPIWAFKYLPTTDGPAHIGSAEVMRKIGDPHLSVFRKYYFISREPSPNLIGHLLAAGFLSFASPVVSEKLLVSLYIVLLPLGARYALRSIHRRASALAFLAFPLVYSYLFAQGFYNFCLSVALFLFVVGYWIRHRDDLNMGRAMLLLGLMLLLYVCHLFSLAMAYGVLGTMSIWSLIGRRKSARRPALPRAAITFAVMLPGLVLAILYRPSAENYAGGISQWTPKQDLIDLLQFRSLVSYRNGEVWLGGGVAGVSIALAIHALAARKRRRRFGRWDALLLMTLGLVGIYFIAHDDAAAHFYIPQRVMLYAFVLLLLWLGGQALTKNVRFAAALLAIASALGITAGHALKYRQFQPQLREFVSAGDRIAPNSTFLPLIFAPRGCDARGRPTSIDVAPFYMAAGYIAARRDSVDLRNYEANTDHFPVRFVPKLNPYTHLAVGKGFDEIPPRIDLEKFRQAGGEVDYVLLWGVNDALRKDPATLALYAQLHKSYQRVQLDGARCTELWKKRGDAEGQ